MPKFHYVAMDSRGKETKGTLEVANQAEAINRVKDMGYFPTKIMEAQKGKADKKAAPAAAGKGKAKSKGLNMNLNIKIPGLSGKVKSKVLATFTRQLATLVDAGLPLLRGLRVLQKQEKNVTLKEIISSLAVSIESGSTFSEALAQHPKVFNRLYVNMVKAGELGGVLEVVLNRLSEFMEKAQKIKGKVVAAMFYPIAVLCVAITMLTVLMIFVIPKFKEIFAGMNVELPRFTVIVLGVSDTVRRYTIMFPDWAGGWPVPGPVPIGIIAAVIIFKLLLRTRVCRRLFDKFKLKMPILGPVISKVAIARFTRTLGTLVSSGVPILQALTIVKETAGNVVIANAVGSVHEAVKEGETITAPLETSGVFPPMVISMVDVGEQTGALPEMLLRIADNYDDEVDNAVAAMTSLLEPVMIIFLALIVGSIVVAMFMPLIKLMDSMGSGGGAGAD